MMHNERKIRRKNGGCEEWKMRRKEGVHLPAATPATFNSSTFTVVKDRKQ